MSEQTQTLKPVPGVLHAVAQFVPYLLAVIAAFLAAGVFIAAMGFNVLDAYATILTTSFKSLNGFVQTLLKWVPLVLLALGFAIPYRAGKYNIGGEGQLIVGAIGATAVGIMFSDLPLLVLLPLVVVAGVVFGGLWASLPAWLLFRFNISEVLSTSLMNFVSFCLIDYVATEIWRDPSAGHPTTIPVGAGGQLPRLLANSPLHSALILAMAAGIITYFYVNRTPAGYELVATGANPRASRVFGINVRIMAVLALVLGGALSGLAGAVEVTVVHLRLIEGMQSNFMHLGIIIGLISKGDIRAVPFVAFFIAVLEVGASAMQRTMMIPVEMVFIVESMILIFVLLSDVVRRR